MSFKRTIDKALKACDSFKANDSLKRKVLSVRPDTSRNRLFVKFIDEDDPVPYENEYTDIKKACQLLLRDASITGFNSEAKRVAQKYAQWGGVW